MAVAVAMNRKWKQCDDALVPNIELQGPERSKCANTSVQGYWILWILSSQCNNIEHWVNKWIRDGFLGFVFFSHESGSPVKSIVTTLNLTFIPCEGASKEL